MWFASGKALPQKRLKGTTFIWIILFSAQLAFAQTIPTATQSLDAFRASKKNAKIGVVFASYYLRNPSSAFGHVFLSFLPQKPNDNILLQDIVNYGADFGDASFLEYYAKGVAGGFDGSYRLDSFHKRMREYGAAENRDVWVYALNLSPAEYDSLLTEIWERMQGKYDYYFFTQNCALQIAKLLDAVKPDLQLAELDRPYYIPAKLIRNIVASPGFVGDILFFPSLRTQFQQGLDSLSAPWQDSAYVWSHSRAPSSHENPDSLAMAAARVSLLYLDWKHGLPVEAEDPKWRTRRQDLIRFLAQNPISSPTPVAFQASPDKGQRESRVGANLSVQSRKRMPTVQMEHRFALHSFIDRAESYDPEGMAEFLDASVWADPNTGKLHLNRLTLFDIRTLSPYSRWSPSSAWSVYLGHRSFHTSPVTEFLLGRGIAVGSQTLKWSIQCEGGGLLREGWNANWLWSGQLGLRSDFLWNTSAHSRVWIKAGTYRAMGEWDQNQHILQADYVLDLTPKSSLRYGYEVGRESVWPGRWSLGIFGYY